MVRQGIDYLNGQTYLEPHPEELMLRTYVRDSAWSGEDGHDGGVVDILAEP
jgi:hypothetical protein